MPKLTMLCGFPGVGKSTFAREELKDKGVYVSRDEIRMRYLQEGDEYFAYETRVWMDYVDIIVENLSAGKDVIADSTNMSVKARKRLLKDIDLSYDGEPIEIQCYYFNVPIDVALARNAQRKGRARVPDDVLRKMAQTFVAPIYEEDERISIIFEVNEYNKIKVV